MFINSHQCWPQHLQTTLQKTSTALNCNMQLGTHMFSSEKQMWIHTIFNLLTVNFLLITYEKRQLHFTIHWGGFLHISWESKGRGDAFISKFWACSIWSALTYAVRAIYDTLIFYRLMKHMANYFNILYFKTGRSQSTKLSPFCHTQATNTCLTVEGQSLVAYMKSE